MDTLRTGDILLFSETPKNYCMLLFDCLIKKCTGLTCSRLNLDSPLPRIIFCAEQISF